MEKYYGPGKMNSVTVKLLEECDNSVKKLLGGWEEDRAAQRKVLMQVEGEIAQYSYYEKLVETGSSRLSINSPASLSKQHILLPMDYNLDIDPRDIDKILNEIAAMVMRFTAFRRFLCGSSSDVRVHSLSRYCHRNSSIYQGCKSQ